MISKQYLIVGQGLCGSFLSWYMEKAGLSFMVVDDHNPASASRIAAGVINPVTGRRIVKTWMIDTLLPFAKEAYASFGEVLKSELLTDTSIINLFPSGQMRNAFTERVLEDDEYLKVGADDHQFFDFFEYPFGHGEITPSYIAQLHPLLEGWRKKLAEKNLLLIESFDNAQLTVSLNSIVYKDLKAEKIIFCDGISSSESPFFKTLPFAPNKGEALVIRSDNLPAKYVFKKAISLVPLGNNLFWAGASHEWEFVDAHPTALFYEKTKRQLQHWLKVPFTIEAHLASIRPATLERRPFVGFHPHQPRVGIFNGMGTKGCSLAPFFAHQFVEHLAKNSSILPEVNVNRFTRILQSSR